MFLYSPFVKERDVIKEIALCNTLTTISSIIMIGKMILRTFNGTPSPSCCICKKNINRLDKSQIINKYFILILKSNKDDLTVILSWKDQSREYYPTNRQVFFDRHSSACS